VARAPESAHEELGMLPVADEVFLAAVQEPHHRPALALLVDEGKLVLQVLAAMQIEELRRALRIVPGQDMSRDIVDFGIAHPYRAAVIERLEIVLTGAQHGASPWRCSSGSVTRSLPDLRPVIASEPI